MIKKLMLGFLFIVCLFSLSYASPFDRDTKLDEAMNEIGIYDEIEPYTVNIYSIGRMQGVSFCSGTIIKNDIQTEILTCKHCIMVTDEMWVENNKVKLIIASDKDDLAILIVDGKLKNKEVAKIAVNKPNLYEKLFMYGHPGLVTTFKSNGTIIKYTNTWGYAKMKIEPGCSGSGLFNDKNEVVGVAWGAFSEGQQEGETIFSYPKGGTSITLFEPLDNIQEFLKEIENLK